MQRQITRQFFLRSKSLRQSRIFKNSAPPRHNHDLKTNKQKQKPENKEEAGEIFGINRFSNGWSVRY